MSRYLKEFFERRLIMTSEYINKREKLSGLELAAVAEDREGYLWCAATNFNGICRIDRSANSAEYICEFEKEDVGIEDLYSSGIEIFGNKIYFIPGFAGNIAVYDKKLKTMEYIEIEEIQRGFHPIFGLCERYRDSLFLFPLEIKSDYIFKIELSDASVEKIKINISEDLIKQKRANELFFFGCSDKRGNFWVGSGIPKMIFEYSVAKESWSYIRLKSVNTCIYHIALAGECLYCLSMDNKLVEYNLAYHEERVLWSSDEIDLAFSRVVTIGEEKWLFPFTSEKIVRISGDDSVQEIWIPEDVSYFRRWKVNCRKYYEYTLRENRMILWPDNTDKGLAIDLETNCAFSFALNYDADKVIKKRWIDEKKHELRYEDDLKSLIDMLMED